MVSPVVGLFFGLLSKSKKIIQLSIFLFTFFFGSLLTFEVMGGQKGVNTGSDGAIHLNKIFDVYQNRDFAWFLKSSGNLLSLDSDAYLEPFPHILGYIFGSVLGVPGALFWGVGLFYGYFYSRSIVKLLSYVNWSSRLNLIPLYSFLVTLALWVSVKDMNTIRTWSGMWVLVYSAVSYFESNKKKYLFLSFFPPLIHVGFFVMALPVWWVLIFGFKRIKIYFLLFLISTIFSSALQNFGVYDQLGGVSQLAEAKVESYALDDSKKESLLIERADDNANFYKGYEKDNIHVNVVSALLVLIFVFYKRVLLSRIQLFLFSLALLQGSLANFFNYNFALYNRSWIISGFFALALVVIFLSEFNFSNTRVGILKNLFTIISCLLLPFTFLKLSMLANNFSIFLFVTPFMGWNFFYDSMNLRDAILLLI